MKIINAAKNTVLADNTLIAGSPIKRMLGLLGRREFKPGEAIIIKPCNSIHTFFMRFAIDVMFLDRENKVVKAIPNFRPFRLSGIYFSAHTAIELPAGTIESSQTHEGDLLIFE